MKGNAVLVAMALLAGCASSSDIAGIKPPKGASAVMLTNRPADQVAACIGEYLQVAAEQKNDGYVLTTHDRRPITYVVHSIDDKLDRYTTQVDRIGTPISDTAPVSVCVLPNAAAHA